MILKKTSDSYLMSSTVKNISWISHFKLDENQLQDAYQKLVNKDQSLLGFALRTKLIPSHEYFTWAVNYYNIPLLRSHYFEKENEPDPKFYKRWEGSFTWSRDCAPLAEWDQCLIVGCLEPPSAHKIPAPAIWILVREYDLDNLWKNFHRLAISDTPETAETPQSNEFTNILENSAPKPNPHSENENNNNSEEESSSVGLVMPEGLTIDLDIDMNIDLHEASVSPVVPSVVPPPPKMKSNTTAEVPTYPLKQWEISDSQESKNICHQALEKMTTHFLRSALFMVDDSESFLTPLFHQATSATSATSKNSSENPSVISLKSPSIFRVVSQTQKPFHGFVVSNPINDQFFQEWNQGETPEHVTIVPIIKNNKLIGMIMGTAHRISFNKPTLTHAEGVSKEFSQNLDKSAYKFAA